MSSIKKLAGQTLWYGVPSIASRFLGYLMNMALPFFVAMPANTADLVQVYTLIPFLNILFSFGLETAYFRYAQLYEREKVYSTLSLTLLFNTLLFAIILIFFKDDITRAVDLENSSSFVGWMIAIVVTDNLAALPFAKLRLENRPKRYAFARISGIVINVLVVILFIGIIPAHINKYPDSILDLIYSEQVGLGYYLIGNFCGSLFTLFLLRNEWRDVRFQFDKKLWREIIGYSAPLVIVGMGGMVNDVMSRLIYRHAVDLPFEQANHELGIFANVFRLALLVTIMIQAFRLAAEPFFFNMSKNPDAKVTYARVMKYFVIACCFMFLAVALYLDVFRYIFTHFTHPRWVEGLEVVPLLAMGNIFLGVYYNLSIWYKLTAKNRYGVYITLGGAAITILLNLALIPIMHYTGAALATYACYFFMMVASYLWGQKHYPVPYPVKKLSAYLVTASLLYALHLLLTWIFPDLLWLSLVFATILFGCFALLVYRLEYPVIREILRRGKSTQGN